MTHRRPMLKAEAGQGHGILWFRKGIPATDAAQIMGTAPKVPILAHEEVLAIGRCLNPQSRAGGASGMVRALKQIRSACAAQLPIRSTLGVSRAVLSIAYSILSNHDAREELTSRLARINSFVDCSEAVVVNRLREACDDLSGLFRLVWEGYKVVRDERPSVAAQRFRLPLSTRVMSQLRDGRDRVIRFPFFQEVRDWAEEGDECGECGVVFELDGVGLLPVYRRTARGYAMVRGAGVLAPLTPLQIRMVSPNWVREAVVYLSGVVLGGYVLGGAGRRVSACRNRFEVASAEYLRGTELHSKGERAGAVTRHGPYIRVCPRSTHTYATA
jgi:hypothetical protein